MAVRTTQSRNKTIENDRRSFAFLIQFFKYINPDHKYSPLQAFRLTSATIDAHVTRNDLTSAIEKTQQLGEPEQIKCLQHFMIRMTALRGANHGCSWSSRNRLRISKEKKLRRSTMSTANSLTKETGQHVPHPRDTRDSRPIAQVEAVSVVASSASTGTSAMTHVVMCFHVLCTVRFSHARSPSASLL